jgi:hypothetical protein
MHYVVRNILNDEELNYFIDYYNSRDHYITQGMEKLTIPLDDKEFMSVVNKLLQNKLDITETYNVIGDNYYRHANSYMPHCDAINEKSWLNIVIPLKQYEKLGTQQFIVFDQKWAGPNMTWIGKANIQGDFLSNKKTNQRPVDSDFLNNSTDMELPDSLWQQLDNQHFDKDYFYGMSGTSYDWIPGDIIVFESQHIHATGKMKSKEKLGLSIRIEKL